MKQFGFVSLMSFAETSGSVSLKILLSRRVTEERLAMFKVDGSLQKTAKSKLLELCLQRRHQLPKISILV